MISLIPDCSALRAPAILIIIPLPFYQNRAVFYIKNGFDSLLISQVSIKAILNLPDSYFLTSTVSASDRQDSLTEGGSLQRFRSRSRFHSDWYPLWYPLPLSPQRY